METYIPKYKPNGKEVAVIETSKGTIKVQLTGLNTPIHVGNFIELAKSGFYNNLKFHRYVEGFVIQGGCPNTRDLTEQDVIDKASNPAYGLGTGGPEYNIQEEYSINPQNLHEDCSLAMARSQHPDSAGSQFYFCLGPQPMLNDAYTVFGQTLTGHDVIYKLRVGDTIKNVTIEGCN